MGASRRSRRSQDSPPGYGWNPELAGLSRPREWLWFVVVVVALILIGMLIAFIAFA